MIQVVRFKAAHLDSLELQEAQASMLEFIEQPGYGEALEQSKYAFSALVDGKVIACSGVVEVWAGRALAWALIGKDAGAHFMSIHRAVSGFLKQSSWRRVEMVVEHGFDAGHRWAKMLGMQHEGLMRAYSPSGVDYDLYARISDV